MFNEDEDGYFEVIKGTTRWGSGSADSFRFSVFLAGLLVSGFLFLECMLLPGETKSTKLLVHLIESEVFLP